MRHSIGETNWSGGIPVMGMGILGIVFCVGEAGKWGLDIGDLLVSNVPPFLLIWSVVYFAPALYCKGLQYTCKETEHHSFCVCVHFYGSVGPK